MNGQPNPNMSRPAHGGPSANQPKKKDSKLKIILKAIYTTIMAFYALYGLYQAFLVYAKFRDLSKGYNNIIRNW